MREQNDVTRTGGSFSALDVWGLAFGCMVGWGAFVMPGASFLPLAGPAGTIISMVIGLAVMLVIGANIVYLMKRSQREGGVYSYTKEAFGRDLAFLCAWFLCLSYLTIVFLNGTALFLVIRTMLGDAAHHGYYYTIAGNAVYLTEVIVSVIALAGVGLLFIVAKNVLRRLATALAVILLAGSVITAIFCLPRALSYEVLGSFGYQGVNRSFAVFSIVILAPWAFVGFEVTTLDTARFNFPLRKIKKVIFSSLILAALVYIAMVPVSVSAIPAGYDSWKDYISNLDKLKGIVSMPTFHAAWTVMGTAGIVIICAAAMAAILTGIIGAYRAIVHVLSVMAEDKILSEKFSKTTYSIFFIMILSIIISLLGRNTLNWFVDLTAFGAIVAYGYTSAAAYKTAKMESNYRIMTAGVLGTVISIIFGIVQIVPNLVALDTMSSEAFLLLSLWCLLGFVFYWHTVKRSSLTEYNGISTSGIVLFALLVYAALMWLGKLLMQKNTPEEMRNALFIGSIVLMLIIFVGLVVMLYIQNLVRTMHESAEREKIRVAEGSLVRSQFLFNMSHDIRTPMNAIIGYTTLALREPDSMLREYLVKIEKSSRQLLDLINDILEMSRIENGKFELEYNPIDLCLVFEKMGELFEDQMRQKKMDFSVHTSQVSNRYVWCDRKNLNRVLLNIISNAYKFTPSGGNVSISVCESGSVKNGYGSYEFRFKDNGIGMSRDFVAKMFNAFERERTSTESGMEGTGLGLAITKSIVDQMGGTIDVFTSPGKGTEIVIHINFRLATEKDIRKEIAVENEASEAHYNFKGKRLLLVEDNEINLEIARMLLEQMDFLVETAQNGKIAVDMVRTSRPGHYDAILMDIQMPVMDGYTATKEIRALEDPALSNIPILAMTANAFQEDVKAAIDAGMQVHIAKPIDINILKKELGQILEKK
ncbi:MAG: amino acid permease [Lentisphaeria bacterium]|nr:amino acid permease [Lentisphaeria bacterium]